MNATFRTALLAFIAGTLHAAVAKTEVFTLDQQAQVYQATGEVVIDDRPTKVRTRIVHSEGAAILTYDVLVRSTGPAPTHSKVLLTLTWALTVPEYTALEPTLLSASPTKGKLDIVPDEEFDALKGPDIREFPLPQRAP